MAQTNTGWEQMHYKCSNFSFTSELMAACPYPNMYEGMFDFLYGNFLKNNYTLALTLSTLGKIFSRRHFEIFFLFFPENRIWHFMQIVS